MKRLNHKKIIVCVLLFVLIISGLYCYKKNHWKFMKTQKAIRIGMSIREVFDSGLADYLISMGNKNVPGGTLPDKQPISNSCERYVLDISYFGSVPPGKFWVRVYCDSNAPSAKQLVPARSFKTKDDFLQALDEIYAPWARSMDFRVESPPKYLLSGYDHFNFVLDANGKVFSITPIIPSH